MPADFPTLLLRLLAERKLSGRKFCKLVGRTSGFLTDVTKGRSAPAANIEVWADKLELTGSDRRDFLIAAAWKQTPMAMKAYVEDLETQVREMKQAMLTTEPTKVAKPKRRTKA